MLDDLMTILMACGKVVFLQGNVVDFANWWRIHVARSWICTYSSWIKSLLYSARLI
jgi:hypothetical protein